MIKQGGGQIVVTSSLSGKYGVPLLSAYSASKHALHGFFESLRAEIHKENIKITIVIPGFVKTSISENALTGDGSQFGKMLEVNEKGISAELCAGKILDAVAKGKEEVFVGGTESFTLLMSRLFPVTFSRFIRNHPMKKLRRVKGYFMFWKR
jgi:short-subunit dehydrogenase